MSVIEIARDSIPWEACATFATGIMAVAAATFIGVKQAGITANQVEIIKQQTAIQELSVRNDLFERRFKIYRQTQEILASIFRNADAPSSDEVDNYWQATDQAQFLFRQEVHQEMVRILQAINTLSICKGHLHGEDALPAGPERSAYVQMSEKELQYILGLGDSLRKIFEPDLSIRGWTLTAP